MRAVVITLLVLACGGESVAESSLVLVASENSPIESLTSFEVRKIYLGIDVMRDGRFVRPLRNISSERVHQIFLQNVVGLTQAQYERRLLSNLLKFGAVRPEEYDSEDELLAAIANSPFGVTYILIEDAQTPERLKVLRVLWEEF